MSASKPLGLSARIRSLIAASIRPLLFVEIKAAFPGEKIDGPIGAMVHRGLLTREGERGSYRYSPGRDPSKARRADDRRAAKNERERRRYAAMSPEQRAEYLARKYASRPKPTKKPKRGPKVNTAYNCVIEPPRPQLEDPPKRVVVEPESVEAFLARGGRIEVLPGVGEMVRAAA